MSKVLEKREGMIDRFSESLGYFTEAQATGYRSLADHDQIFFAAWDSPQQNEWTIEIAWIEGEDISMPAGERRVLNLTGNSGVEGSLRGQIADGFREMFS